MKAKHTYRGVVMRTDPARLRVAARPAPPPVSPSAARVRVGREVSGRGGKGVSVITGLPLAGEELEALATRLKKTCGAGGGRPERTITIPCDAPDLPERQTPRLRFDDRRS